MINRKLDEITERVDNDESIVKFIKLAEVIVTYCGDIGGFLYELRAWENVSSVQIGEIGRRQKEIARNAKDLLNILDELVDRHDLTVSSDVRELLSSSLEDD